jgi:hypothetical protein
MKLCRAFAGRAADVSDNLQNLDISGTNCQFKDVYLGPSLGWKVVPVVPQLIITSAATFTVPAYASRVLLNAAVKSVLLPKVSAWMLANTPQGNIAAFDRSLWFKDLAYAAGTGGAIVFTPNGTDKIDGFSSYSLSMAGGTARFYPMTDLSGWYVEI